MYTIISLIVLLISYQLFKKAAGSLSLTKLNMISWVFIFNIFLQSFLAAVLVVNNWDNHYLVNKVNNESSRLYGWLSVMYVCIMLPLGMLLVNFIIGKTTKTLLKDYASKPLVTLFSVEDSYIKIPLFCLSMISILAVLYTFISLPEIPLVKMIKGASAHELAVLRGTASRSFQGNELVRNILGIALTPILTFIYYSYYKLSKSRSDYYMFILMFFFTFLILTYNLAKATFIYFLLGFLYLKILIDGKIPKKVLFIAVFSAIGLIIVMYVYISQQVDVIGLFTQYNTGIVGRIILSQSAGTYLMFDMFPDTYDFIGFESISSYLSSFLDIPYSDRAARSVMFEVKHGEMEGAGVVNSLFVGEAWANFGLLGLLLSPVCVGVVIQTLFITLLSMKKTPIYIGVLTYFSYKSAVTGGFNEYLYNVGNLLIIFLIAFVYLIGGYLKKYL